MSRNKHQYHRRFNGNHPIHEQDPICFEAPVSIQIEQRPTVSIPLDDYMDLVRIAERAKIAVRYASGEQYGIDKDMLLVILGADKSDEGADDA